jgi:hypothetical protein
MLGDFEGFLLGAALNLAVAIVIVRLIYAPGNPDQGPVFSFLAFSTVIYFLLQFLTSVELSLGFGFGLFAIFSILRYRTEELAIRDMSYLFTVIGLAVMNSFLGSTDDLMKLVVANAVLVALLFVLERGWGFRFQESKRLIYDKIDLIRPENRALLERDLRERTGLPVTRVEVGPIDFLRDTAELRLFYTRSRAHDRRAVTAPIPDTDRVPSTLVHPRAGAPLTASAASPESS